MDQPRKRRSVRASWGAAVLALALIAAGEPARAQSSPAPASAIERAGALTRARAFAEAAAVLRDLLSADPANREAKEMLAFDLESMGDLEGERRVRSALAVEFPDAPRVQADFGRVLERSGDEPGALRAYRRARELSRGRPAPELEAAIERIRGLTAPEFGAPLSFLSDPDASDSRAQAGATLPLGSRRHLALVGRRDVAEGKRGHDATTSDALALTLVQRTGPGATWAVGPRVHAVSPRGARTDVGVGGVVEGRAPLGPALEADGRAELEGPWDEAAIAVLRGGRTTAAEGHLYLHGLSRHLLLQAGARTRQFSLLAAEPSSSRPRAWQSVWLAGADVVLWRKPGAALSGEMLDESLIAPTTLSSALTVAYRHFDVASRTTPDFGAVIGLVPHASVDEASITAAFAEPRGRLGLELEAGLARDSARGARLWRAGGSLIWAATRATRFMLGYEGATEVASGLVGQSRAGRMSIHADL
jgi:hypothetical protein